MTANPKRLTGDKGESFTVRYLKRRGWKILERNYRKVFGEIDIIAQKGDLIAFVEVKTRRENPLTQPYEAVDYRKRQRIIKTAAAYLAENETDCFCRFDVSEVFINSSTLKPIKLNYIENAFETESGNAYY